jgi:hypothetical protein
MELSPEEKNHSTKVTTMAASMPIPMLGSQIMLNRMANCPLEN